MTIYREEIFGPVLSVVRADSYDCAAKIINEHEFGNGTANFTRDGDAAREFAGKIQVGMVGINVPIPVPMAFHSFGGWKASLLHAAENHHLALADEHPCRRRLRHADDGTTVSPPTSVNVAYDRMQKWWRGVSPPAIHACMGVQVFGEGG
jgi:hypothetical protein